MKRLVLLLTIVMVGCSLNSGAQGILGKIKDKVNQRKDQKIDNAIDKGLDKTEDATKKKNDSGDNSNSNTTNSNTNDQTNNSTAVANTPSFKTYANYDFVPGNKIIFEDNFSQDQDGEFPSHWDLINGQGVLNKLNNEEAFYLTDGNYVKVSPLMKTKKYLGTQFTIEFDTYCKEGAYGLRLHLNDANQGNLVAIQTNSGGVDCSFPDRSLSGSFPEEMRYANYFNKWHHFAVAFKNGQIKVYCDAMRVLVVPNCNAQPDQVEFAGIGAVENPIIFKNIRVAEGGGMNMLGKKFTDSKIITHGINFDVNKAVIKPESMGTLNAIVQIMKDNPEIKFEIGGHTDGDGDDALNLKLSQQRAEAVRIQLISMGIEESRLTAKGYGKTKPVADNTTFEGKANNRRVEFVKN